MAGADDFAVNFRRSLDNAFRQAGDDRAQALQEITDQMARLNATHTRQQGLLKKSLEIPVFTGDKSKDKISPQEFIARANAAQRATQCTDAEILEYAICKIQGDAWIWINNGTESNQPWSRDWTRFQTEFLRRFIETTTVAAQVELRNALKQGLTETVQRFWDRCTNTIIRIERANQPARTYAELREVIEGNSLFHFMSGLKPELRAVVTSLGCETSEEALQNAIRAEQAEINKKKDNLVLSIQDEEVSAIQQRNSRSYRGRGRGRGRGFRTNTSGQFQRTPFQGECYTCGQKGHKAYFCPQKPQANVNAIEQGNEEAPAWNTVARD